MRREPSAVWAAVGIVLLTFSTGDADAATPSMKTGMPPEVLSWREEILTPEAYRQLVDQWREYTEQHPRSSVAHVQLARAMRYSGAAVEEQNRVIRRALELDPRCPETLDAFAGTAFNEDKPLLSHEEAVTYCERALALAPGWPYPHFNLCSLGLVLGRMDLAREHARALVEERVIPTPLLDFAYNMLASAEPGATIITNGDNDTYPLLALQAARGMRPDVVVAAVGALDEPPFTRAAWRHAFGDDVPFADDELAAIQRAAETDSGKTGRSYAVRIMSALCEKVGAGEWNKPVYFALTVAPRFLEACRRDTEIQGLLWRVLPEPAKADESAIRIDTEYTRRLVFERFRLESATDLGYPWSAKSAILLVPRVYAWVLRTLAERCAGRGDLETARLAFRRALVMLEFHDDRERLEATAASWKEIDPDNPEVNGWMR